jgi:hypothetical protein
MRSPSQFPQRREQIIGLQVENVPMELRRRPLWCCWQKDKRPLKAEKTLPPLSIHETKSWVPFHDAATAYGKYNAWGVGTLLNGDGLSVVDIDHCVDVDGLPDPNAVELLKKLDIGYVEISPSGRGLHGFGYLRGAFASRINIDGVDIELYQHSRFITVTGYVLWSEGLREIKTSCLYNSKRTNAIEDREDREDREEINCNSSVSSIACIQVRGRRFNLPTTCVPTTAGQRHRRLFQFARVLKGEFADLSRAERKGCVTAWHELFLAVIETKDFGESWLEFENGWQCVKRPYGEDFRKAVEKMVNYDPPDTVKEFGAGICSLFQLCRALADQTDDGVFFLSLGVAADVLRCDEATVSRYFKRLIGDEVLLVEASHTPSKARRFKFTDDFV